MYVLDNNTFTYNSFIYFFKVQLISQVMDYICPKALFSILRSSTIQAASLDPLRPHIYDNNRNIM